MKEDKILFTGGHGLLGSEVKQLWPNALYPTSSEFNVTDYQQMQDYLKGKKIELIVHAAAFTSPPLIDKNPEEAINANIIGTANIVKLCMTNKQRLVYISTDYVFKGNQGNYKEDAAVNPVNKYAWSKMGGECAVNLYDNALIIRTSFGPNEFPYPKAFIDQWTSRESVRTIAAKIVAIVTKDITGIVHIGGKRRTVYEYAKSLDESKEIAELSIDDLSFAVPKDTSLDCSYYAEIVTQ
ncbi:sugar nucleotide-binding protein [Candidatus Parabeggiatoa sp. HSG14]|uniref:SDR family oxidoreductase n=1 Tax=Candidatus Parabeggiatoa sp. HSG14 TaxID=3055593 RepID=UPI0025A8A0BC|nr:sugar nucleotide-binding protein [Thiotrichales bacterium HSG14]